jgi:hypothetical protein
LSRSTSAATSSVISASSLSRSARARLPSRTTGVQQDLDVDLVVGAVHAGRIVDGVGVDAAALQRVLDAPELGEAEVAALGDDAAAQIGAVHPDRVVRAVADFGVRLLLDLT